jgi:hypothetical protein
VRDLAKTATAGSDAQKQLTDLADKLAGMERQTTFYDRAHAAGVKNLRLAYLAAQEGKLVDEKGEVDWEKFRKTYPELFAGAPAGNAGNGTGGGQGKASMNDWIRQAAGRK